MEATSKTTSASVVREPTMRERETFSIQSRTAQSTKIGTHSDVIRILILTSKLNPSRGILLVAAVLLWFWSRLCLDAILLHPPVQGASAQAERLGSLTHVAIATSQCLADENTLYRLQAHIFKRLGGSAGLVQAQI